MAGRTKRPTARNSASKLAEAERIASLSIAEAGRGPLRYSAVYAAVGAGAVAGALAFWLARDVVIQLGAIAFFLAYLVAMLFRLPTMTPAHLRSHADESDIPGYLIMLVALLTLAAASVSLFLVLNGGGAPDRLRLVLGIAALALGWLGVNSMLAFHYAYEYYGTDESGPEGKDGRKSHVGGLDFPGNDPPDALSFLYFSFVIAMTAQVSDVEVTSNAMRRLVLLHGILSYFVTTVVLAVAVNVVVSLGH